MKKTTKAASKTTPEVVAKVSKVAKVAPASKPAKKPAVAVKKTSVAITKPVIVSKIAAVIDVGFGNALYIRGEGPGLNWDQGLVMDCVADNKWLVTLGESSKPIVFKLLINDQIWCLGDDYIVPPGSETTVTPVF